MPSTPCAAKTACSIIRVISSVAERCPSTAIATLADISLIGPIVLPIPSMARTASPVAFCKVSIWIWISSVAFADYVAKLVTSGATNANPIPASLARAA